MQAIHGYRETERLQWNEKNSATIDRLREIAFPKSVSQLKHVHILDLAPKGYIKPHIDAVRVRFYFIVNNLILMFTIRFI